MSTITLDPELRARLNGLNEQLEVRDESGTTVGHFVPAALYRELLYAWARSQPADAMDRARVRQEVRTVGGLSTTEAIVYLERQAHEGPAA